ncbi:hypothetical protein GCM10007304_15320 [Rhodococcoides trifolii]|uniref:DUF2029 domain-containing protein n=1 Tax=Rhodococcoides trifolii TaxID=908250 RepID=A0A917FSV5_9NOCA|nr:DUF2029 domain-containing protein [Rhodococcus trifolii]GGG02280.1 hypothetical protein GCM10007304_15320 [Rhodococcus trifolii]
MSAFVSAMRFVGDLDNEFYHDEHQRDVWNEASAIGFQLCLWAASIAMAVLPWFAGTTGSWIAVGLFVAVSIISLATLAYSKSRRVDVQALSKPRQPRALINAALIAIAGIGVLVKLTLPNDGRIDLDPSTISGLVVGAVAGGGAALFLGWRSRKKQRALDTIDEDL